MGMFDSVVGLCRECGRTIEFQSKAGECSCEVFSMGEVPIAIASDLSGSEEKCEGCGTINKIVGRISSNVAMSFEELT